MHSAQLDLPATDIAAWNGVMSAKAAAQRIPSFAPDPSPAIVQASCLLAPVAIAHLGHGHAGPGCFFVPSSAALR